MNGTRGTRMIFITHLASVDEWNKSDLIATSMNGMRVCLCVKQKHEERNYVGH